MTFDNFKRFTETVVGRGSVKMIFLKILQTFRGKHLCMSLFFNKEETLAQVFSCEFCKIFKNTSLTEHLGMTASGFNCFENE